MCIGIKYSSTCMMCTLCGCVTVWRCSDKQHRWHSTVLQTVACGPCDKRREGTPVCCDVQSRGFALCHSISPDNWPQAGTIAACNTWWPWPSTRMCWEGSMLKSLICMNCTRWELFSQFCCVTVDRVSVSIWFQPITMEQSHLIQWRSKYGAIAPPPRNAKATYVICTDPRFWGVESVGFTGWMD